MQLLADNEITEITIQTLFDEEGKFDNIVTAAAELFLDKNPKYVMVNTFRAGKVFVRRQVALRMFRQEENLNEIFHWIPQLEEMSRWPQNVSVESLNTLGIGSYNNYKDTLDIYKFYPN